MKHLQSAQIWSIAQPINELRKRTLVRSDLFNALPGGPKMAVFFRTP